MKRSDQLKRAAGAVHRRLDETADEAHERLDEAAVGAKGGVTRAADKTKTAVIHRLPQRRPAVDLTQLPTEAKLLYCRALAVQAKGDTVIDPREVANLYLYASILGLDEPSRAQLRQELSSSQLVKQAGSTSAGEEVLSVAHELADLVGEEQRQEVMKLLVRDLIRIARADRDIALEERRLVGPIATHFFPSSAEKVVREAEELLEKETNLLAGKIAVAGHVERTSKGAAADAAAVAVPLTAVYVIGSASSGAAAISSGLAGLGVGGVLGLSGMMTGIGTAVILGLVVQQGTRYVLGLNERASGRRREFLIQQVLTYHAKAIADLTEDIAGLASRMQGAVSSTTRNEGRLAQLKVELAVFQRALGDLRASQDRFVLREPVHG